MHPKVGASRSCLKTLLVVSIEGTSLFLVTSVFLLMLPTLYILSHDLSQSRIAVAALAIVVTTVGIFNLSPDVNRLL